MESGAWNAEQGLEKERVGERERDNVAVMYDREINVA